MLGFDVFEDGEVAFMEAGRCQRIAARIRMRPETPLPWVFRLKSGGAGPLPHEAEVAEPWFRKLDWALRSCGLMRPQVSKGDVFTPQVAVTCVRNFAPSLGLS